MAASYPTTAKSFATKEPNTKIKSEYLNDIQVEIMAMVNQLITSKLASLAAAPVGAQVLTSVAGAPTWRAIADTVYPVGSIYMSVNSANPSTLFGGTWSAWGTGRVPVGIDAGQTEFDAVEETGGAKTHTNTLSDAGQAQAGLFDTGAGTNTFLDGRAVATAAFTSTHRLSSAGTLSGVTGKTTGMALAGATDAGSSLQPYITCYMWKRTA